MCFVPTRRIRKSPLRTALFLQITTSANQKWAVCKHGSTSAPADQSDGGDDVFYAYALLGIFMICNRRHIDIISSRYGGSLPRPIDAIPLRPDDHLIFPACMQHLAHQHGKEQVRQGRGIYQIGISHSHRRG